MSERKIFISKRCGHSIKLIVGLSKHDLLKYFDVVNIDTMSNLPSFITSVPTLFHNGQITSGEQLFDYMNDFAKKIMTANDNKEKKKDDDELEAWCPDGGCSIGFSEISESDDNFKEPKVSSNPKISLSLEKIESIKTYLDSLNDLLD